MGNFPQGSSVRVVLEKKIELVHGKLALPANQVEVLLSLSETIKTDPSFYEVMDSQMPLFTKMLEKI